MCEDEGLLRKVRVRVRVEGLWLRGRAAEVAQDIKQNMGKDIERDKGQGKNKQRFIHRPRQKQRIKDKTQKIKEKDQR
jgi:hypothetical protein